MSRPPSLAQHFDAPEDYIGCFGWLCGYSADALFLNDATERFTQLTPSQRAHQGRIALAVLLDPGNPPISLLDAPGVAHFPIKDHQNKPFRLLHAKVALLGFQHNEERNRWQLRLLVSTGNWTQQTLEKSLDLVWRIDIASESLSRPNAAIKQDCMDIKAAWDLLVWIGEYFDTRLLNANVPNRSSETTNALQQVSEWIKACSQKAQGQPRFFDNRKKSLLLQLPEKIEACEVKRNYLAMGSGFYEESTDAGKSPKVPMAIVESLKKNGLLTTNPTVDIYVNPMNCQTIATAAAVKQLQSLGITIRPAATPQAVFGENAQRTLHAKFLFSVNNNDSDDCTGAWVYLGSGNLTHAGFANNMSASAGNLEAGVVFAPNSLCWQKNKASPESLVVTNLLPIQWDEEIGDATSLAAGPGMELRAEIYVAPPVAWLIWYEADGVHELRAPSADDVKVINSVGVQALDSAGKVCPQTKTGRFRWPEAQPRQVRIRWQANNERFFEEWIPVVDQYGRIAATELTAIDIDEAWWQLADFPMPPLDEDAGNDEDGTSDENEGKSEANRQPVLTTPYPIRQMMELIENIAAKQTGIDEMDWVSWCNRLEQTLGQAFDSAPVKYFREEFKLNPLSPLRHPSFRPSFAEDSNSELGNLYDETLNRIEKCWAVD